MTTNEMNTAALAIALSMSGTKRRELQADLVLAIGQLNIDLDGGLMGKIKAVSNLKDTGKIQTLISDYCEAVNDEMDAHTKLTLALHEKVINGGGYA